MTTETVWMSVETPSVFREIEVPADEDARTAKHERAIDKLADLAERYGTHIVSAGYRRG